MTTKIHSGAARGFSMIELLLVAFILGVGLLGLTALMAMNVRASGGGRQRDAAAYLANDVMETLAADGRMSSILRVNGQAIPATYQLANAVDNTPVTYQAPDTTGTVQATFDMEGRPSATNPIFSVQWARLATKSSISAATTNLLTAEVIVNVSWNEAPATQGGPTVQKWLSFNRMIRY